MSFLLGMLATLLFILAGFCEVEGWRQYRVERVWTLLEQQDRLTETAHSGL